MSSLPPSSESFNDRWAQKSAELFDAQVAYLVQRVRDLADRLVERGRVRENLRDTAPDHLDAASSIIHELQWGMANLSVEILIRYARDADMAARVKRGIINEPAG